MGPQDARLEMALIRTYQMYALDYPHSECQLPNSVDNVLSWSNLKLDTTRKLLWGNATRFYKRT